MRLLRRTPYHLSTADLVAEPPARVAALSHSIWRRRFVGREGESTEQRRERRPDGTVASGGGMGPARSKCLHLFSGKLEKWFEEIYIRGDKMAQ